ncbi:MAG: MFS transporter, partial [Bacteroidia bacterium]|nr:MFS transporter [Bacteroidia bacterium]MBT8287977.1 MFS transporter [Bacteroidia bacterium]
NLVPKLATQMAVILMISYAVGRFLTSIIVKSVKWIYISIFGVLGAAALVLIVLPMAKNVSVTEISTMADLPLVSFLFPMIGLFLAPLYPLVSSTVLSGVDKIHQSPLAGILVFFSAVGGTSGSLIIGYMFDRFGGDKVFYLSLIPMAIILITIFRLNKIAKVTA